MKKGVNQAPGVGQSYRSRFKDDGGHRNGENMMQSTPNELYAMGSMDRQS